jgi:hypothetical protein
MITSAGPRNDLPLIRMRGVVLLGVTAFGLRLDPLHLSEVANDLDRNAKF